MQLKSIAPEAEFGNSAGAKVLGVNYPTARRTGLLYLQGCDECLDKPSIGLTFPPAEPTEASIAHRRN